MGEQCTFKQSCTHHNLMCNYPHCNYGDQKRRESQAQLLQDANSAADIQITQLTAENERLQRVVEQADLNLMFIDGKDIFLKRDGFCFFVGSQETKPDLFAHLKREDGNG